MRGNMVLDKYVPSEKALQRVGTEGKKDFEPRKCNEFQFTIEEIEQNV